MTTKTIAATGGDFTTLAAWEATLPATLVEDEIAEIVGSVDGTGTSTSFSSITSPTSRIIIRAAVGQETTYVDSDGKSKIEFAAFDLQYNGGAEDVHWEKIAIGLNSNFQSASGVSPAGSDWTFSDCYIFHRASATGVRVLSDSNQTGVTYTNCLIRGLRTLGANKSYINCDLIADFMPLDLGGPSMDGGLADRAYCANNSNSFGHFRNVIATDIATSNANEGGNQTPDIINAALLDQYTDPANGDWTFKAGNVLQGAAAGGADIGFVVPTGGGGPSPISAALSASAGSASAAMAASARVSTSISAQAAIAAFDASAQTRIGGSLLAAGEGAAGSFDAVMRAVATLDAIGAQAVIQASAGLRVAATLLAQGAAAVGNFFDVEIVRMAGRLLHGVRRGVMRPILRRVR